MPARKELLSVATPTALHAYQTLPAWARAGHSRFLRKLQTEFRKRAERRQWNEKEIHSPLGNRKDDNPRLLALEPQVLKPCSPHPNLATFRVLPASGRRGRVKFQGCVPGSCFRHCGSSFSQRFLKGALTCFLGASASAWSEGFIFCRRPEGEAPRIPSGRGFPNPLGGSTQ